VAKIKNILFIMADQLRWDYLSCYGHPNLKTPNIDRLASKGVLFESAFVQSPVCGPSRASTYTGRTVFSHGSTSNQVPLPIGELTIGDYLREHGMRVGVVGKTHMKPDIDGMERLGITKETEIGLIVNESGFEPYERDDGLHPDNQAKHNKTLSYNQWLNKLGYEGENPWDLWANSAEGENGEILSGWKLRNSNKPSRIAEEHSETAYMTNKAIEYIEDSGDRPWFLHLSYIKPHWPYIAPAPYHNMYSASQFSPLHRNDSEKKDAHPVYQAFMNTEVSKTFSRKEVRETVITGYMGLIKQIDDNLGRLFKFLEKNGQMDDTMIVFTSDHGDYLGDHWLGEKEFFHEQCVKVPLIIYDPSETADISRGSRNKKLVEAIDLLPTFLDATENTSSQHRLEGKSLLPILRGDDEKKWRDAVFSEIDYAFYHQRKFLNLGATDARAYMIRTNNWKYIYFKGFPPQLFDLINDPDEFHDLGQTAKYSEVRDELKDLLLQRLINRKNLVTVTEEHVLKDRDDTSDDGVMIGVW
jgi:arylsulfatase A-like enzyme